MPSIGENLVTEQEKLYDDLRERALEELKLRYPLPNDSPAVLMQVALQAKEVFSSQRINLRKQPHGPQRGKLLQPPG